MRQSIDPDLQAARYQRETFGIPDYAVKAWLAHRQSAAARGIPFRFTLLQWHLWWKSELRLLGPAAKRGRRRGEYVMARLGDSGAYEPGNVRALTPAENHADRSDDARAVAADKVRATVKWWRQVLDGTGLEAFHRTTGDHLRVRGDGHPRSKAVVTPLGRFGSIALASEAHGFTRQAGHYAVKRGQWTIEA